MADDSHAVDEQRIAPILLRAGIYRALALGLAYPTAAMLQRIVADWQKLLNCDQPWPIAVQPLAEAALAAWREADSAELQAEHIRLFGPAGRCPPSETAYGDAGRMLGKAAQLADISGFYLAFGMQTANHEQQAIDHLALELEFMSILGLKEALALSEDWEERWAVTSDAQAKFARDHLGIWTDAWYERLRGCDSHPCYLRLGETIQAFVRSENQRLAVAPHPLEGLTVDKEVGGDALVCPLADEP
ncbi:MAG: molecular chaperone TorD family protein [Gammaproteobacteria bacterium]